MKPFFQKFKNAAPLKIAFNEIIPDDSTDARIRERAVYFYYARKVVRRSLDGKLRVFRQKAMQGALNSQDYAVMNEIFERLKKRKTAQLENRDKKPESAAFYHYARINSYAMLLSQILFVQNCVVEEIPVCIDETSAAGTIDKLTIYLLDCAQKNHAPIQKIDARFYATLFLFQTAFDRLFVPDENIVAYNFESGAYQVTAQYEKHTAWLELSNKKVLAACDAEKALCRNLTTGWSDGIDLATWDKLNAYYYAAISPTTGEAALFTKNYDVLLERMLPQFTLSKIKLAEDVLDCLQPREKLNVLEIGAGSGAFAIDLLMACKRRDIPFESVEYFGVEPSEYMRQNFRASVGRKIGSQDFPKNWRLLEGRLENVNSEPKKYLRAEENNVIVLSFSIHHCFYDSAVSFLENREIKRLAQAVFVLEGVREHGWTKPYYMWADCESPENFNNVILRGAWDEETLWIEPNRPLPGTCVTTGWSCLRKLT